MTPTHSIWLMPRAPDAEWLSSIVADLAQRFGTPVFAPHLTLRGDAGATAEIMTAQVGQAASEVAAFGAAVAAIETSEAYFRSFYARFPVSPPLAMLKQSLDGETADAFLPHVSLLYGAVALGPKAAAAARIGRLMVGRILVFDRLCVVRSGQDISVAEWSVRETALLGRSRA